MRKGEYFRSVRPIGNKSSFPLIDPISIAPLESISAVRPLIVFLHKPLTIKLLTLGATILIWILRRPEQLRQPYVWAEESFIFRTFLDEGFLSAVVTPVQGQLILVVSLFESLILTIAPQALPELGYLVSTLVMVATVSLLLFFPLSLPLLARCLFALSLLLVPADPETFGVLLYTFWWTSLWPLILIFSTSRRNSVVSALLGLSGLSSLAAGALFPLYLLQWKIGRSKRSLLYACILALTFTCQVTILLLSSRADREEIDLIPSVRQLLEYPGDYAVGWLLTVEPGFTLLVGLFLLAACLFYATVAGGSWRDTGVKYLLLGFLIVGSLSALPEPLVTLPNVLPGARYFFLPFVALSWLVILLIDRPSPIRPLFISWMVLGLLTLSTSFSRFEEDLDWRKEILTACGASRTQDRTVRFFQDGYKSSSLTVRLTKDDCETLSR